MSSPTGVKRRRVDMTHSVTKTFLSTVVGLAWQKGLIRSLDDRVGPYMPAGALGASLFESPHNQPITWDHLLRQTSDWQGTLWDKPDWADRPEGPPSGWSKRPLHEPGTRYKYNDVRVNLLALATLQVFRRPLPDILREEVMEPIGASSTWRWHGYDNSWIDLDGRRVQSVSGGGHWGGGMFINAWDMARFGYLFLRNGSWKGREIVSPKWIAMARTPGKVNPAVRVHELVSEYRQEVSAIHAGVERDLPRQRPEHRVRGLGERPRRRGPLDRRRQSPRRIPRARARVDQELSDAQPKNRPDPLLQDLWAP